MASGLAAGIKKVAKGSGNVEQLTEGRSFGAETTASEVLAGVSLTGKLAVVTGSAGGLGAETARALAEAGADVVIAGRSAETVAATAARLSSEYPAASVQGFVLDLDDLASVDAFADKVLALGRPIDLLIANAGIMATPFARNAAGVEQQLATNFVGHAVLVSRLAAALRSAAAARLVVLSSSGHHFGSVDLADINFNSRAYDPWIAYGQSKTACALLALKVFREMGAGGVTALAVHPGVIATGLMKHLTPADYAALQTRDDIRLPKSRTRKTVEQGAATSVWAATAPELTGRYAYLEDCALAEPTNTPNSVSGYLPYVADPALADALWRTTEQLIGRSLPL